MGEAKHPRYAPLSVAPQHPHVGEAGTAGQSLLTVNALPFLEKMLPHLHCAPTGDWIDVHASLHQCSSRAPFARVLPASAIVRKHLHKSICSPNVEASTIVVHFHVVSEEGAEASSIARTSEKESEEGCLSRGDLLDHGRSFGNGDCGGKRCRLSKCRGGQKCEEWHDCSRSSGGASCSLTSALSATSRQKLRLRRSRGGVLITH